MALQSTKESVQQACSWGEQLATQMAKAPFVCGTSALGNLYRELEPREKLDICAAWFEQLPKPIVIDTAGRYGAGLALDEIGRCLRELRIDPNDVIISNKLGWKRIPLVGDEPTFEPGLWKGLKHDAEQAISYKGVLQCWQEGCRALGEDYRPQLVSIHDPDEYLDASASPADRERRFDAILEAYRALDDLKKSGEVALIGVGAKDWSVIRNIDASFSLDWIMFATLLTLYRHPKELVEDVGAIGRNGVTIINAGVFHSGFLVGGPYFDYQPAETNTTEPVDLFAWRQQLYQLCEKHDVRPAQACVQFATSAAGISTVALNCDNAQRVAENLTAVEKPIPSEFWRELRVEGIIAADYPFLK